MFIKIQSGLTNASANSEQDNANPPRLERKIVARTTGRIRNGITRLISPDDLGHLLKPFVFLDYFDASREPLPAFGFHPHSGIATLTFLQQGNFSYEDTSGAKGELESGGVEWIQSGAGVWHRAETLGPDPVRGFQLWIALPPEHELDVPYSQYQSASEIATIGSAKLLLGEYNGKVSNIAFGSSTNYLAVSLKNGESWCYQPPPDHTVLWIAVSKGAVSTPTIVTKGELVGFQPSGVAVEFVAQADTEFVLGSSTPHRHELITGYSSVHTTLKSLAEGEKRILKIGNQLREEGRL